MYEKLEQVKELATRLHGDQKRKYTGEPYVNHTFRVADIVKKHGGSEAMVYAAVLHDVVEDTSILCPELLIELMSIVDVKLAIKTATLVKELTDVFSKDNYPESNRKMRKEMEAMRLGRISSDAQTIKYADLLDNSEDILRNDPKFAKVYLKEKETILNYMKKGNTTLYQKCLDFLEN
jgi:(p)ppGpp synthase/HD superfamily hydrolase